MNTRFLSVLLITLSSIGLSACHKPVADGAAPGASDASGEPSGQDIVHMTPEQFEAYQEARRLKSEAAITAKQLKSRGEFDEPTNDEGSHSLGDYKFAMALAAQRNPKFLQNNEFIELASSMILGDEEYKKYRNNEFEWPKHKTVALGYMKKLMEMAATIKTGYTEHDVVLSAYDTSAKSFPLDGSFRNIGEINLTHVMAPENTDRVIYTNLILTPPISVGSVTVSEDAARKYVDSLQGGRRDACLRIIYTINSADGAVTTEQEDGIKLMATPLKYELFYKGCQQKLGEQAAQ